VRISTTIWWFSMSSQLTKNTISTWHQRITFIPCNCYEKKLRGLLPFYFVYPSSAITPYDQFVFYRAKLELSTTMETTIELQLPSISLSTSNVDNNDDRRSQPQQGKGDRLWFRHRLTRKHFEDINHDLLFDRMLSPVKKVWTTSFEIIWCNCYCNHVRCWNLLMCLQQK
jgi:hypothetical protein